MHSQRKISQVKHSKVSCWSCWEGADSVKKILLPFDNQIFGPNSGTGSRWNWNSRFGSVWHFRKCASCRYGAAQTLCFTLSWLSIYKIIILETLLEVEDSIRIQISIICSSHLSSLWRRREKKWIEASWELELSGSCVALNFYRQEGEMWFMGTTNLGLYTQWKPTVNISFIPLKATHRL